MSFGSLVYYSTIFWLHKLNRHLSSQIWNGYGFYLTRILWIQKSWISLTSSLQIEVSLFIWTLASKVYQINVSYENETFFKKAKLFEKAIMFDNESSGEMQLHFPSTSIRALDF